MTSSTQISLVEQIQRAPSGLALSFVDMTLISEFRHVAKVLCHFCQITAAHAELDGQRK